MLYVASAQPATAQLDAFACDFLVEGERCLVINKLTRLQVWSVHGQTEDDEAGEERVQMELEIPIWGTIAAVSSVKVPGQSTCSLLVLTTSLHLFALSNSPSGGAPVTISTTSILEPYGRLSSYQTILVDPLLRCIIIHTYNGLIHVIPLTAPKRRGSKSAATKGEVEAVQLDLTRGYNVRLQSLNVTSIAFLPTTSPDSPPSIAMLFSDHLGRRVLESHVIDLEEKELSLGPIAETVMEDPGSEIVVPVEGTDGAHGGVVVVGEQTVVYVAASAADKGKGTSESTSVKAALPVGMIQAFTKVEREADKFLLGDIYGKLILLDVIRGASGRVVELTVTDLGDTSSPTAIVYLGPALLYLSSRFADSQLVRLPRSLITGDVKDAMDTEEDADGGLQLITSFASLSPILDCCVVPAEGGGASHVVTCSGAYKGGSLRVVRQGVGLSELASLEMENIQRIWSLKRDASMAELLVLSSFNETRVLSFASADDDEDEIEEIDIPAFTADAATLLACHVGPLYIQVTSKGIAYSNGIEGTVGSWSQAEGKKVTLGATDGEHLVLAVEGGLLVVLKVDGETISQIGSHQFENEIACLDVATIASRVVAAVGLWTVQTVLILAIPTLEILSTQVIESDYLIRSVLITTFADGITQLFAGLGDGALTSFIVDAPQAKIVAETSKTVTLGTRPIVMCGFEANGVVSIFVSSDRPTVISRTSDKLVYSSVNLKNINAVVSFNSTAYPSSLALASPTELRIGRIDDISAVDIRAIPLEEDEPRRIAHDPVSHTYGVVCLRRDIDRVTGDQVTQGSVKIFDDQTFEVLADIALDPMEECQSIISLPVGDSRKYVVGTAFVLPTESEPTKGRLLLFGETASRSYELTSQINVDGCAYALAALTDNHVAAAVNSQVEVFSIDSTSLALTRVASWGGAFISLSLVSCADNTMLVGDALRSITLLKFHVSPPKIEEVSRDYNTRYMAAIESLGGSSDFIGAETDLNLFTVQKENVTNARSMADEFALAPRGVFHLGEMVSKFQHGSLVQQYGENAGIASPRLIFSTSAGSLGVIVELDAASSKILSDLERNMRRCTPGIGAMKQEDWRSFKSERTVAPSAGFVDGNFVELFLELSADDITAVLEGGSENEKIQVSRDALMALVEELARLH